MSKIFVIGLDCASPELVFEKFIDDLPNLRKLIQNGIYGKLKSCIPAITIPAWTVMVTGKDPGTLGMYGFRHRKDNSYTEISITTSYSIKEKTLWEIIAREGKKSCLVGIPPSYPPIKVNGALITCFMTPDAKKDFTYPRELKEEIEELVGEYIFDVVFRTEDRDPMLKEIYEMTEKHFQVIEYLLKNKEWDFFMFVEIGVDRIHHTFWKFFDKEHHLYKSGNKYENVILDYYKFLDEKIGRLLKLIDNNTRVLVVSDHGVKRMKGAFCVNEWLIREGYLVLKNRPEKVVSPEKADIDWKRTKAWGWGGYYARIFLNMKGREKNGIIEEGDYENIRDEITEKIKRIKEPDGNLMDNKVFRPEEIYEKLNGNPPDLMVYFDNLYWRSAGTIGHDTLYLPENDTGPDDAMHDEFGIFILYDPKRNLGKEIEGAGIEDIAPTILNLMNIPIPKDMKGKILEVG